MVSTPTVADRLRAKVVLTEDGCWVFTNNLTPGGYAKVRVGGRLQMAHRVSYETFVGPIPDGLQIDHLCRIRACVNPKHLEPVTRSTNVQRGLAGAVSHAKAMARTHCAHGHPWTPENTSQGPRQRRCRACNREQLRRRRVARRAADWADGVVR